MWFIFALHLILCTATAWIAWTAAARDSFLAFSGIGTCSRARSCTESKQLELEKHLFPSHRLPTVTCYDKGINYRRVAPQTRPGPFFSMPNNPIGDPRT
ncbi:hypothetical protein H9L39_04943 [Fusarium oxysporum f. sp. albedinis]|nr:hypothetical protein H9L39_04943 [Fusarium oxysporum f. sp. albedinis]